MAGSIQKKRETLFNYFSSDLEMLMKVLGVKLTFSDGKERRVYICPISREIHAIESAISGLLTLEHVPPKSMGGKGLVLIPKRINNLDGSSSDVTNLNHIQSADFFKGRGPIPCKISATNGSFQNIKAQYVFDTTDRKMSFILPKASIDFLENRGLFRNWANSTFKVNTRPQLKLDEKGILKYAFLLAFERIKYQLIYGANFSPISAYVKISEHLLGNIDKLPIAIYKGYAPLGEDNVGIVTSPQEYRSLVVNFELTNVTANGETYPFAVFLPNPYDDNLEAIDRIRNAMDQGETINFKINSLKELTTAQPELLTVDYYNKLWINLFGS